MSEQIEGRNAVLEAFRSGKCVDKLFILDGCQDDRSALLPERQEKRYRLLSYVAKERLDQLSETGAHQGVIAQVAAYEYASVEDILAKAREKGEDPFILSWIILRILIILVQSSVQQTLQVHMG